MTYGKGMIKTGEMNAHKSMAGAGSGGNFGIKGLPQRSVPHADVKMTHMPMEDSVRGAKPGIGGGMAKQAAPDHGPMGKDHFSRSGSV